MTTAESDYRAPVATGGELTPVQVLRSMLLTAFGLALFAASLTVLFLGMRDVMDVGGACSSGQTSFEIAVECPDTAWTVPVSIFTGIAGLGLYAAGVYRLPGPKWWVLAWPALFLSLGWNFWEYGLDPPLGHDGVAWGFISCGVMFVLMGGVPLVPVLRSHDGRRRLVWGDPPDQQRSPVATGLVDAYVAVKDLRSSLTDGALRAIVDPPPARPDDGAATSNHGADPLDDDGDELADSLERLATLHRSGDLTDDEFRAAKARLIGHEPSR
jgi:hypothetical protein